jgi:uncharacterized coiled-coil protein SlyX
MLSNHAEVRIAELEEELRILKASSHDEIARSQIEVDSLRRKLGNQNPTLRHRSSSISDKPTLVSCTLSCEENSLGGSFSITESVSVPANSDGTTSLQASTNFISEALGSFNNWSQQREERRQTRIEQDLLRQLQFLHKDKARCVRELELKLSQREAAIATLETALQHMDSTINMLRDKVEILKSQSNGLNNYSPNKSRDKYEDKRSVPSPFKGKASKEDTDLRSSMVVLVPRYNDHDDKKELNSLLKLAGKASKEAGTQRQRSVSPKVVTSSRGGTPTKPRNRNKSSM